MRTDDFSQCDDSGSRPHDTPDALDVGCAGIRPATWVRLFLVGLTFYAAGIATVLHYARYVL